MRLSMPRDVLSRLAHMASISSMTSMHGALSTTTEKS